MPGCEDLPLVLTPKETAKLLRCGKSTIYEQIRCNRIGHLRLGRRILIPRSSLMTMLESANDGQHPKLTESQKSAGSEARK